MIFFYAHMIISAIFILVGPDLKKWYNWLIGLYGLIVGLSFSLVQGDVKDAVMVGLVFAFYPLAGGAMTRWHRQTWPRVMNDHVDLKKYPFVERYWNFLKKVLRIKIP